MNTTISSPAKNHKNWGIILFIVGYQLLTLFLLPYYLYWHSVSSGLIATTITLFFVTGLSITAGYHRYYSHRTYRTNSFVEAILLFFGSMAAQSSALRWSYEHRLHHAHVDTDDDPYSIKKGFWHAHWLWMIPKHLPINPKVVSDLINNKLVAFQHKYILLLIIGTNALMTIFLGWIFNDYFGAFVFTCLVRLFALHHCTWFINSLAHTWGDKPFCKELSAVDNYFLSILTFGEGYHNFHHTFANDYRNGIRWYHFDPTKWLIWSLSKLGLAYNLRRTDPLTIDKRVILESKNTLLQHITTMCHSGKEDLEILIHETSEKILAKITQFNEMKAAYLQHKKENPSLSLSAELRRELKIFQKGLKKDWREWIMIYDRVMNDAIHSET